MSEIEEFFQGLFSYDAWPPRWKCGYWSDFHGWLYIISELMVWAAYFMMPLLIINYFYQKRMTIRYRNVYLLFATFILLCGSTHFLDALMFWIPMYRFNAIVRLLTGVVSLFTVYHLIKALPELFKQKTNVELEQEIARRKETEVKLAAANQSLQAFAYVASHDLQEPLRKIRTFTSRLYTENESKFDDTSKDYITKLETSAERMQRLIRDVLNLSSLSEEVELTIVDTNSAVQSAIENLELKIQEKGAIVKVGKLPKVKGNEAYLSQLFYNLIGNGIKFNNQVPVIDVSGVKLGEKVTINVTDNGIGMKEEYYLKVFEAFGRLHSKSEYEGTGIGLAICKKIVDVHKGQIRIESKEGIGTTFKIELDVA